MIQAPMRLREIPYNYTSYSDREIFLRFLNQEAWDIINALRSQRQTGQSARMLFEVLGDMWVITRNPYIQDDLASHPKRWQSLTHALHHRLDAITQRADHNTIVLNLVNHARLAVDNFIANFQTQQELRKKVVKKLSQIMRKDNICFDGLSRVAHATDASDWRIEFPLVVLKPESEQQIPNIVKYCTELGLVIIARGGGTGYTGGVIPLHQNTAVINLEKLETLSEIRSHVLPGLDHAVPTIKAGAGVVTRRIADAAMLKDLVFAVDPTSQDASTIGGNIAMNAGGKKALLWGTTLDNLASWSLVNAKGNWIHVERINHNLSKIHLQDEVSFTITEKKANGKQVGAVKQLMFPGQSLRKLGLGKDVTNKFLNGLPGIQKEGCDGIITSATFILHPKPKHIRTFCCEFFGKNLQLAVPAIVEITRFFEAHPLVNLAGLEHLDDRYIKAVNYSTKAPRQERPKMVLLGDIVGDDEEVVAKVASQVIRMVNNRNAEGFIAVSPEARAKFWLDRARTAAISAHTNAFKINEDVVIPLDKLATYNDFIEHINIEQSILNKLAIIDAVQAFLNERTHNLQDEDSESQTLFLMKKQSALTILQHAHNAWQTFLSHLDDRAKNYQNFLPADLKLDKRSTVFELLQSGELRISYRDTLEKPLKHIFNGENYQVLRDKLDAIHAKLRRGRIFIALHMHAGDGNVHTNIPVHSNNYHMLHSAEKIVARIMQKVSELDGAISGEHGIGITKLSFLPQQTIAAFAAYKKQVDPHDYFNRGKLIDLTAFDRAFTPSFRLLEQEAIILEASELGELNTAIKDCVRCGKCKPKCQTHIPRANLYYSPRDKILGTGAIIEAFLYEEQTRRGISLQHFTAFNDIADHCTTCHHCKPPCPVDIDFGDVSIKMRSILREQGQKQISLGTKISMLYLNATNPLTIKVQRQLFLRFGFATQRLFFHLFKKILRLRKLPPATSNRPKVTEQVIHFMQRPLPNNIALKPVRQLLTMEDEKMVPILRDPNKVAADSDSVFYFPGCGSERLFSQVALASLAVLYAIGTQTVLPPGYLCCGYPQLAEGNTKKGNAISAANRVLFHRVANTLNYLDIKTVIVSCGTCYDQLNKYQFDKIFPGCRIMDIHEYLMEKNVKSLSSQKYLYHDPCHTPIKIYQPLSIAKKLLGDNVVKSDRCCGDAGTLSMARPDIATQLRYRKQLEIEKGLQQLTGHKKIQDDNVKMLTTCPACVKGLSAYQDTTGIKTGYIVEELAYQMLGADWQKQFIDKALQGGIERVLL